MLRRESVVSGLPVRLYRSADEIKRDISELLAKSFKVRELFSVRELLATAMDEAAEGRVSELYYVCEELLEAVSEAKDELSQLDCELDELKCEIISTAMP